MMGIVIAAVVGFVCLLAGSKVEAADVSCSFWQNFQKVFSCNPTGDFNSCQFQFSNHLNSACAASTASAVDVVQCVFANDLNSLKTSIEKSSTQSALGSDKPPVPLEKGPITRGIIDIPSGQHGMLTTDYVPNADPNKTVRISCTQ
jgi:hypothetical protein